MLSNPVFRRETVTSLRTIRALTLGIVFLVSLSALVILLWPTGGLYSASAQASHKLFIALSFGFLSLVIMCAPSFTAVCITSEKEGDTFDLLYDTLLTPFDIVLGKVSAGVVYVLILIFSSLPMMGACHMLGGVGVGDVVSVYAIVVLTAIFFGLIGFYASTVFRSSYRSLIFCYVAILSICALTWVPSVVMGNRVFFVHGLHLIRAFSPFSALTAVVNPEFFSGEHSFAPVGLGLFADGMYPFVGFALLGSGLLFALSLRRVARPSQPRRHNTEGLIVERMEQLKRHVKFPFYLIDPRKRKRQFSNLLNVVAIKEMRAKTFSRSIWLIRSIYGLFMVSLVLAFLPLSQLQFVGIDTIVSTCISVPLAIIIFVSPVLTASVISEERETGVFDLLRCTHVGPWTLVMGKLQVSWLFTSFLLLSTLPTFFVLAFISSSPKDMKKVSDALTAAVPPSFRFGEAWGHLSGLDLSFLTKMGAAFGVMLVAMLFATLVGVAASAFCRRSSTATALSYGVILGLTFGTFLPHLLADNLPRWMVSLSLSLNPFAAAANAVSPESFPGQSPSLWVHHLLLLGGTIGLLLLVTLTKVWTLMRPQK